MKILRPAGGELEGGKATPRIRSDAPRLRGERSEDFCAVYGAKVQASLEGRLSRAISRYFDWREAREKHPVSKKTYMRLMLLGIVGAHRFYARHYGVAVFYLLTCWCGVSVAMTVIDAMVAIPMPPDENGNILL